MVELTIDFFISIINIDADNPKNSLNIANRQSL